MNTKLDSALALATLSLLMLVALVLSGSQLYAQEPMALRLGTTMSEAQTTLTRLPYLSQEASGAEISLSNAYLQASYHFNVNGLERMNISRAYTSESVANAAMDGYLVYLGRINATLVPVIRDGNHTVYYAMTEDAHYELNLEAAGRKDYSFTVRIQSRNDSADAPDRLDQFLKDGKVSTLATAETLNP